MDDMVMKSGACKFCGQRHMIEIMDENNEEELERLATLACECTEAIKAKEMGLSKEQAQANIETMFKEEFPEIVGLLNNGIELIVAGKIDYVLVNTGRNVKAKVSQTPNGKLKVERFEQQKKSLES